MSYFILVDMFSYNSDNNKFEDANNVEHDFYRIMLVECVVVVPLTLSTKKKNSCRSASHRKYGCFEQLIGRYGLKQGLHVSLIKISRFFKFMSEDSMQGILSKIKPSCLQ